ncbi:MAG: low molecular weight phosphotyrosine protein phosphatase [Cellvibrionaceae bacterium]|nr:low molecular weight phosphotyrosine protein phosphatase [Cellvibrionaceae bacterium]
MKINVLFVCLGNICRSPTAQGLFQARVDKAGFGDVITVDSAGTGDWHIGRAPDSRAQTTAQAKGYDISHLRARQVSAADFDRFDYILGMDKQNVRDLAQWQPAHYDGQLGLFLDLALGRDVDVPDPYYGDQSHFEQAIQLIDDGAQALLQAMVARHGL